jgi:hypothetical protein
MKVTRTLAVVLVSAGVSACVTGRAAETKREPLAVPQPPPRVIAPVPEPEAPPQPDVSVPEPVPPLPRASRVSPPRSEPKQAEPATPPDAATATPPPGGGTPPAVPPSELRTPETPDDARATKQVRDTLGRASGTLGRIDYRNLSQPGKLQYDMAKRFMEQADEALKAKNYTAAQLMAEKAETIAKELSGR